jgi:hypothetical protein
MNHYELSALVCDSIRSLWQQGKFVTQYCDHRNTSLGKDHETNLQHSDNQPGGDQKPTCSFHGENVCIPPSEASMKKVRSDGDTKLKSRRKRRERDLRVHLLKSNLNKLLMSDNRKRVRSGRMAVPASTVVSSWARDADNDLRALFLSKATKGNFTVSQRTQTPNRFI